MADWRFWRSRNEESAQVDSDIADPPTDPPAEPLWTDDAIESDEEDDLDRRRFADMAATRIDSCVPGQKSTVFGLVGSWGSGKTSLINLVRARLRDDWKIAIFSPWASDTAAGLQFEFLAAVASLLDGEDEKSRNAKKALRNYASVCAPLLKAIPYAGAGLGGAAEKALELTNPPWHRQFEDVSKTLASLGSRVLLIADDIDRLDADELLSLLKVVRLLGRFPNVHYLIAYDQTTVESLLKTKGLAVRSAAFMEKIVQYPFEVPPIAGVIQRRELTKSINELLDGKGIELDNSQIQRMSDFIGVIAPELETPRAQVRFKEQLLGFGGMVSFNEIDVVDFVALSFLRVFYHDLYSRIPSWKTHLQTGKEVIFLDAKDITDDDWTQRISPLVGDDGTVIVKQILSGLFPGIRASGMYAIEHERALSDDKYFQRFFLFGVADDDVEDQLIQAAIQYIILGDDSKVDIYRYRVILESGDEARAGLAYEKSHQYRAKNFTPSSKLTRFLFEQLSSRPKQESFGSATPALRNWLDMEAFEALRDGELTVDDLISELSPKDLLALAFRITRDARRSIEDRRSVLGQLGDYYRHRLTDELPDVLSSELDFNSIVFVIAILSEDGGFLEFGDSLISDGKTDLLDRVCLKMVVVNPWQGSGGLDPELAFNSETLVRLFAHPAIPLLAELLPDAPPLAEVDKDDISLENKAIFGRANVRSIAQTVS